MLRALLLTATLLALAASPALAQDDFPALELNLFGGGVLPTTDERSVDAVGYVLGASALLRMGRVFGLGLQLEREEVGWNARGSSDGVVVPGLGFPDDSGAVTHDMLMLALRFYFARAGIAEFFTHLSLGYGSVRYSPDHPDCSISDGVAAQHALGSEFRVARMLGVHTSLALTPFGWGMGCNDIGYAGKPPSSPYLAFGISARVGATLVFK